MASQKSKRPRKLDECKLIDYNSLPTYLKDNEFILEYYRCEWPLKQTLLSIFYVHNETLNIWTHLIGFFIFLALTFCATGMLPSVVSLPRVVKLVAAPATLPYAYVGRQLFSTSASNYSKISNNTSDSCPLLLIKIKEEVVGPNPMSHNIGHNMSTKISILENEKAIDIIRSPAIKPVARWPFFAFLLGTLLCLLASSSCHLLSCHSNCCSYVMLRLDYAGISALIVTSFYPLVYYSFTCDPIIRYSYISFITAFGLATVLVSLLPVFQTPGFRLFRSALFFCMGISGVIPVMHKLLVYSHHPDALLTAAYELLMGVFYIAGMAVYVARVPERWMPGKFDLVGNSHQWFHLLVVAGAYTHYLGSLVYLQWRDSELC